MPQAASWRPVAWIIVLVFEVAVRSQVWTKIFDRIQFKNSPQAGALPSVAMASLAVRPHEHLHALLRRNVLARCVDNVDRHLRPQDVFTFTSSMIGRRSLSLSRYRYGCPPVMVPLPHGLGIGVALALRAEKWHIAGTTATVRNQTLAAARYASSGSENRSHHRYLGERSG